MHSFHSDEIPHFEVLKVFPQNIEKRIYEIKITQDGKYAIFINRWSLSKISLETLRETQFLNHRQLVQGGFTGIGISEDGEKILAGGSWTHKASLYNWSGVGLAHFSCASGSFFVYDARLTLKDDQVLILCYDFVNDKKEIRSFDQKGNLKWRRETKLLHLKEFLELDKFITYEDKNFSIWDKSGRIENSFFSSSKIISVTYANEPDIFLLGNSKEWSILKPQTKEALLNVQIEKDIFYDEEYKLSEEFKSFYQFFQSGKFILTGGKSGGFLWSTKGKLLQHLNGHQRNVTSVALSPKEDIAITASPEKWIVWKRVN